jgi:hypothetical protein
VRNRSKDEIEAGLTFEQIREAERREFSESADLQFMPHESRGTDMLISRLVTLQRKMVLGHKLKFKEDLVSAYKKRQHELVALPPTCQTDLEKSNHFKDCVSNLQKDIEFLAAGQYQNVRTMPRLDNPESKSHATELRWRARFDELLKSNRAQIKKRFANFHSEEYYQSIEQAVVKDKGIHLPNVFDFTTIYRFISAEVELLKADCSQLIDQVSDKCFETINYFILQHFKRFKPVQEAISDRCRREFESIRQSTLDEVLKMLAIEQSQIYLSDGSNAEYEHTLSAL